MGKGSNRSFIEDQKNKCFNLIVFKMPSKLTVLKTSNTHSLVWVWDNTSHQWLWPCCLITGNVFQHSTQPWATSKYPWVGICHTSIHIMHMCSQQKESTNCRVEYGSIITQKNQKCVLYVLCMCKQHEKL